MASKYIAPIKWLGGAAIVAFIFALVFPSISSALLPEEARRAVLVNAIPFFAAFVGILLLFILLIVLVALRYNGQIPRRTYQSIEYLCMGGILFGVVCLFQPFSFIPYRYGFLLLLVSTLSFILWSHVIGGKATLDGELPPIGARQKMLGLLAAILVVAVLTYGAVSVNQPQPPYGVRERLWNSYDDARKAAITDQALGEFRSVELPFLVIFNLFPGAAVFLIVREVFADRRRVTMQAVPAVGMG